MRKTLMVIPALLVQGALWAQETSTFRAYVDTDLCARLMLGPITPARIECSQSTAKDNSQPVLVRLRNNMVFSVNKTKMIRPLVGQFAEVSGKAKVRDGTMKLEDAKPIEEGAIAHGDPERKLLDAGHRTDADPKTWEKVRHELAMMPYISEFDFISFTLSGSEVILTGWTVRQTNRDDAFHAIGCRLSDQIVDSSTVPGASFRFADRLRQRDPPPGARDIDEAMNSEWIAFAHKQREAAIP
jgi:hypothetical protein